MLPLAGAPRLAIVGKEVICGRERADLLAVEVETGRPVVPEIKLASNTDRRRSLTQVLGYAAYLRRLNGAGLNAVLRGYLDKHGYVSIADAAKSAAEAVDTARHPLGADLPRRPRPHRLVDREVRGTSLRTAGDRRPR
jgi:hypothetical protein